MIKITISIIAKYLKYAPRKQPAEADIEPIKTYIKLKSADTNKGIDNNNEAAIKSYIIKIRKN